MSSLQLPFPLRVEDLDLGSSTLWMIVVMILRKKLCQILLPEMEFRCVQALHYSSKVNFQRIRPMIQKRIQSRAKEYPVHNMIPVAQEALRERLMLIQGVSSLLKVLPVAACKFCPEVYIGEKGHLIKTCHSFKRRAKNGVHEWVYGGLNDVLVPVETFHLHEMFQDIIKHQERFDYPRVPAVLELCYQAGASIRDESQHPRVDSIEEGDPYSIIKIANNTLKAWENLRSSVKKLLLVYPARVCKHCSEVHVGPSGHKARVCGVFKYESWRGTHFWKKAEVDDLVPPKVVWWQRPQDPPVLVNEGREFYGHAPAVVALCAAAGAVIPVKYRCQMKTQGLSAPVLER